MPLYSTLANRSNLLLSLEPFSGCDGARPKKTPVTNMDGPMKVKADETNRFLQWFIFHFLDFWEFQICCLNKSTKQQRPLSSIGSYYRYLLAYRNLHLFTVSQIESTVKASICWIWKTRFLAIKCSFFSRHIGVCLPFENVLSNRKKDQGALLQKRIHKKLHCWCGALFGFLYFGQRTLFDI